MMVLRRATTLRATRLQVEAEAAQEAAMTAPLARLQVEAIRRPRRSDIAAGAGALPRPDRATGVPAGGVSPFLRELQSGGRRPPGGLQGGWG